MTGFYMKRNTVMNWVKSFYSEPKESLFKLNYVVRCAIW